MSHRTLLLPFTVLVLLLASCGRQRSHPPTDNSWQQIAEATKNVEELLSKKQYEKARQSLETAIRTFPTDSIANDSTVKYARNDIACYLSGTLTSKDYAPGIHFLESLDSPFIRTNCLYELLASRAHLYQMAGDNDRAVALADSFAALPAPQALDRLIPYSEMVGCVYYYCSHDIRKATQLLEKAVDAYHRGGKFKNMGRVFFRLGAYYSDGNQYEKAIQTNREAVDYYEYTQKEDPGILMVYGELANQYEALDMHSEALQLNRKACRYSLRQDSFGLGDLYRYRSDIFFNSNRKDSALYYLHQANAISQAQGSFKGVFINQLSLSRVYLTMPDSLQRALDITRQLCADSAKTPQWCKLQLKLYRGQALLQSGQVSDGVQLMEEAVAGHESIGMLTLGSNAVELLMDAYLKTGMKDRFIAHYPRHKAILDSIRSNERIRALATANIRFETQKKEQQNNLLSAEIELKNSTLRNYAFGGASLLLIAICLGCWLWMRQKALRLHLRLEEQEHQFTTARLQQQEELAQKQSEHLQQLITSRKEINNRNQELLRQLAEIQASQSNSCHLDRVMESLQPRLLTSEEEKQFRTSFNDLYPKALLHLRTACPKITRTDELLCMLILLKQSTEEISHTLGINRPSVLQTRYRLRQKLSLPENSELDNEIRRIMVN